MDYLYFYVRTWVCQTCHNFYLLFLNIGRRVQGVIFLNIHNIRRLMIIYQFKLKKGRTACRSIYTGPEPGRHGCRRLQRQDAAVHGLGHVRHSVRVPAVAWLQLPAARLPQRPQGRQHQRLLVPGLQPGQHGRHRHHRHDVSQDMGNGYHGRHWHDVSQGMGEGNHLRDISQCAGYKGINHLVSV